MAFGGGFGSQLQGFQKTIPSHPYTNGAAGLANGKFEGIE